MNYLIEVNIIPIYVHKWFEKHVKEINDRKQVKVQQYIQFFSEVHNYFQANILIYSIRFIH